MASDAPEPAAAIPANAVAKKRMPRRRKKKMIIAIVAVVAALVVVFWGWSTTGARNYLQVGTLVDAASGGSVPDEYLNRTIEVQGKIVGWSGDTGDLNFSLADRGNSNKTIRVTLVGALPGEFENLKNAVVKGQLDQTLPLRLVASEVTLGCAARY